MSTLSTTHPTLMDVAKRLDPDGRIDTIVDILAETNEVLPEMTMLEGNLPTGHRTTMRTGLPAPTWRKLYGGVQPSKSSTVQITDTTGMLEAYAEVDKALADLNGNTAAFRLSEDRAHIEGINQEFASSLFYASEASAPEEITGFAPRYNSLSAENAENIVQESGITGQNDCSSIWLVVWGPNTCHGIYPKGSQAGLQVEDKGSVTIENVDGSGGRMEAYRTHYRWDVGLTVRDWRYVVRVQFDSGTLTGDAASGANLIDLMTQAVEIPPSLTAGRAALYCNRRTKQFLRRQIVEKVSASTLTMDQIAGKHVMSFDGIPVRRVDSILNTESAVA
jgi:hypothetical protein